MLAVDHVVVVVHDLMAAARRYYEQTGLASVVGGLHPGHGTGNRIVPLGDSYIELMAVVDGDEAAASPLDRGWSDDSSVSEKRLLRCACVRMTLRPRLGARRGR